MSTGTDEGQWDETANPMLFVIHIEDIDELKDSQSLKIINEDTGEYDLYQFDFTNLESVQEPGHYYWVQHEGFPPLIPLSGPFDTIEDAKEEGRRAWAENEIPLVPTDKRQIN